MLKLFGAGADHPMKNPKEARRILEALPADEVTALDELAHWMESVSLAEAFKPPERAALLLAVDEVAQTRVRKISRDYSAAARPSRYQENRMWTNVHEYCRQAALAFGRPIDAAVQAPKALEAKTLVLISTRALRALAQQIKWQHMRYGPVDPAAWGTLNRVFALCEARGFVDAKVALYPAAPETSPRQEFLRAVMFSASSPDSLLAAEADLAERTIADLSPHFLMSNAAGPGVLFWTDLGQAMAPLRLLKPPEASAGLRYFGPGNAALGLQAATQRMEAQRNLPASGSLQDPEAALDVLRHLALVWSPEPPERRHTRHNVKSRLTIAHGFAGTLQALGEGADSLDFNAQKAAENWVVENVSAGGFGAVVPQVKTDWLRVGTLIAMQPDGGTNWIVGAIRRVNRTNASEARVGIETVSRAPRVAKFRLKGLGEETGLLLPSAVLGSGEVSVALRAGAYPPGTNLEATIDGREHVYMPQGAPERAEDYELVRFREMIRES